VTSPQRHLWMWYTPGGLGGVETFLLQTARAYANSGVEMCLAGIQQCDGPLLPRLQAAGVRLLDWSAFYPAYMNQAPAAPLRDRLCADLAELRPAAIVLNGCTDFATGAAPLLRRLRPFCTILDVFHIDPPDETYLKLRRPYLDVLDGVVSSNAATFERLHRLFPATRTLPTRYIPYAAVVPDRPRRLPGDVLRLLYVGRLIQEQKRILDLPGVLDALRRSGRAFAMTVVGDGPQAGEVKARLEQLGLLDHVCFAGYVPPDDVMEYLFEHDVLLNLSTYEGFSISVIEAFAAGCVPVCTRLPGLDPAVFVDGQTCRLCPIDRLEEMAPLLQALTPATLIQMSDHARKVGAQFTVERMTDAYRRFLAEARERRPPSEWPADPAAALSGTWDLTRHNPWIPHPHPVKQWLRRVWSGPRPSGGQGLP
jgi:glycosyltransferase involved in cell wall biosynthesis